MDKLYNNYPDVKKALANMKSKWAPLRGLLGGTAVERAGLFGAGFLIRNSLSNIGLKLASAPVIGLVFGGFRGRMRAIEKQNQEIIASREFNKREVISIGSIGNEKISGKIEELKNLRAELTEAEKNEAIYSLEDWKNSKIKELSERIALSREKLKKSGYEIVFDKGETKILKARKENLNFAQAGSLTEKIDVLIEKIEGEEDEKKRKELRQRLGDRIYYTYAKLNSGTVSFSEEKGRSEQYGLLKSLSMAEVSTRFSIYQKNKKFALTEEDLGKMAQRGAKNHKLNNEIGEYTRKRLNRLLAHKDSKIRSSQREEITKQMFKAALISAGFGTLGMIARHFAGEMGLFDSIKETFDATKEIVGDTIDSLKKGLSTFGEKIGEFFGSDREVELQNSLSASSKEIFEGGSAISTKNSNVYKIKGGGLKIELKNSIPLNDYIKQLGRKKIEMEYTDPDGDTVGIILGEKRLTKILEDSHTLPKNLNSSDRLILKRNSDGKFVFEVEKSTPLDIQMPIEKNSDIYDILKQISLDKKYDSAHPSSNYKNPKILEIRYEGKTKEIPLEEIYNSKFKIKIHKGDVISHYVDSSGQAKYILIKSPESGIMRVNYGTVYNLQQREGSISLENFLKKMKSNEYFTEENWMDKIDNHQDGNTKIFLNGKEIPHTLKGFPNIKLKYGDGVAYDAINNEVKITRRDFKMESSIKTSPLENSPPSAKKVDFHSVKIEKGSNLWEAGQKIIAEGKIDESKFWKAWGESKIKVDGKDIPIHKMGLVHEDDILVFNEETKLFEIRNDSGQEIGTNEDLREIYRDQGKDIPDWLEENSPSQNLKPTPRVSPPPIHRPKRWVSSGDIHFKSGDYQKAIKAYERGLKIAKDKGNNNLTKLFEKKIGTAIFNYQASGTEYQVNGNHQKAIEVYKNLIEIKPNSSSFHFRLGDNYRSIGQYTEAIQFLKKSIEKAGENETITHVYNSLGLSYIENEQYFKAIEAYGEAMKRSRNTKDINEYKKLIEELESGVTTITKSESILNSKPTKQHAKIGVEKGMDSMSELELKKLSIIDQIKELDRLSRETGDWSSVKEGKFLNIYEKSIRAFRGGIEKMIGKENMSSYYDEISDMEISDLIHEETTGTITQPMKTILDLIRKLGTARGENINTTHTTEISRRPPLVVFAFPDKSGKPTHDCGLQLPDESQAIGFLPGAQVYPEFLLKGAQGGSRTRTP